MSRKREQSWPVHTLQVLTLMHHPSCPIAPFVLLNVSLLQPNRSLSLLDRKYHVEVLQWKHQVQNNLSIQYLEYKPVIFICFISASNIDFNISITAVTGISCDTKSNNNSKKVSQAILLVTDLFFVQSVPHNRYKYSLGYSFGIRRKISLDIFHCFTVEFTWQSCFYGICNNQLQRVNSNCFQFKKEGGRKGQIPQHTKPEIHYHNSV